MIEEHRPVARVGGETTAPGRHALLTEIKGVTFHGLRIERDGTGWQAQVLFDV